MDFYAISSYGVLAPSETLPRIPRQNGRALHIYYRQKLSIHMKMWVLF